MCRGLQEGWGPSFSFPFVVLMDVFGLTNDAADPPVLKWSPLTDLGTGARQIHMTGQGRKARPGPHEASKVPTCRITPERQRCRPSPRASKAGLPEGPATHLGLSWVPTSEEQEGLGRWPHRCPAGEAGTQAGSLPLSPQK